MDDAEQARIKRELEPFVHAAQDMKDVAGAALYLRQPLNDSVRSVLETGLITAYARPFTRTGKLSVKGDWSPKDDKSAFDLHDWLIWLRDKVYAHTDRTEQRQAVNVARMLGLGGNLFKQQRTLLDADVTPLIAALAGEQQRRFEAEVRRLESQLPDPGPVPVPLYYRASTAEAEAILAHGFTDAVAGTLESGEQLTGVTLRDSPVGPNDDPDGGVLLFLQIPGDRIRAYEVLDFENNYSVDEWVIPAELVNEYGPPQVIDETAAATDEGVT